MAAVVAANQATLFALAFGAVLEMNPEKAVTLSPILFNLILSSLEFGLGHHDPDICQACLETVYDLARHHFNAVATSSGASQQDPMAPVLQQLVSLLLQKSEMQLVYEVTYINRKCYT